MKLRQWLPNLSRIRFLPLLVLLALAGCEIVTCPEELAEENLRVNAFKVDCVGEGPRKCLLVQQNDKIGTEEWNFFYEPIEGFTHQDGFVYDLRVRVRQINNPPADGSSLRYLLVKEISRTASASN